MSLNPLSVILKLPSIPASVQDSLTKGISYVAPNFLVLDKKEITFERHPLQTLYSFVERAKNGEVISELQKRLDAVPEKLRNAIYFEVWSLSTDSDKGGDKWGERNALNDPTRLLKAIATVAEKTLNSQQQEAKNAVYGTIYRLGGQPQTSDPKWGENHANEDPVRLIRALHRNHRLEIPGKEISVYSNLEKGMTTPSSCHFHIARKELATGQICMNNGMGCTLDNAKWNAYRMSDQSAQGYNIHCVYSATVDPKWDLGSAILSQGGTVTPAVIKLLEQWQDFFESRDHERLLMLCTSRGAIEVDLALKQLPKHLQQRMIVISIAPACLIDPQLTHKAFNLAVPSDPVFQVAANRHLVNDPCTIQVLPHEHNQDPHDLFGTSFQKALGPMIDQYIRTNDL